MNLYRAGKFAVSFSIFFLVCIVSYSRIPGGLPAAGIVAEISSVRHQVRKKPGRIKKPVSSARAIRKQKAEDRKRDREYKAQLNADRKRHFEIQSTEVRERMRLNKKATETRYSATMKEDLSKKNKA